MTFFIERRIFGDFKFRRCLKEEKSEGSVEREGECGNVVDLACDSAYTPSSLRIRVYTQLLFLLSFMRTLHNFSGLRFEPSAF